MFIRAGADHDRVRGRTCRSDGLGSVSNLGRKGSEQWTNSTRTPPGATIAGPS